MTVKKNKHGVWEYNFMLFGKRYHRSFKDLTRDEVKAKEDEAKVHIRVNGGVLDKPRKIYLSEIINDYKVYRNTHCSRQNEFDYVLNKFAEIIGEVDVNTITVSDLNKYIDSRIGKVTNNSINREMDVVRRIFSLAVENKKLKENPCSNLKKLRIKNPEIRILTKDEEEKLLGVANLQMAQIIVVAIYTGLRTNELLNLKWEDVFLKEERPYLYARETKNNKPRKIPIINKVKKVLMSMEHYSEYVFTSSVTMTKYEGVRSTFTRTVKRAEIHHITFHKLRHTTASRLNELGVDIVVIKEILGQKDIKTTMRYLHTTKEYINAAMQKLDSY